MSNERALKRDVPYKICNNNILYYLYKQCKRIHHKKKLTDVLYYALCEPLKVKQTKNY